MKKKTKILNIAAGTCMAAGLLLLGAGWTLGGCPSFSIGSDGLTTPSDYKPVVQNKTKVDPYNKIKISIFNADIYTEPSDDENYYIEYKLFNIHKNPLFTVKDQTLTVKDNRQNVINFLVMPGFSNPESYIKVYIPESSEFENIAVSTDDGNIEFNVSCKTNALEVSNSYGNTSVTGMEGSSLMLNASDGNVSLKDCTFEEAAIENSYGNIYGSNIAGNSLAFDLSDGDLQLKKADFKDISGDNAYGNINLNMTDSSDKYDLVLSSENGSVTVNNSSHGSEFTDRNGRPDIIKISSSDGNIKITTGQ